MWWWIGASVVLVGVTASWVWMAKFTDLGARSRKFERSDREIAEALREAQRGRDQANFYHHR